MKLNEIETREHAILRVLIRETLKQQSNMTNEGFMDALKSLVSSLLGDAQESFDSPKGVKAVEIQPLSDKSKKFNPLKDPESQLIAVESILRTVNYSLQPSPKIQSIISETKEVTSKIESILDGTHPDIVSAKKADFTSEEYVEKVTKIYKDYVDQLYKILIKNVASSYGYFAGQLKTAKFSNEDWYKNVMDVGKSAKPAETASKTLKQWADTIVKIEGLQLPSRAKAIVDSDPVQELLKNENKARFIQKNIDEVMGQLTDYDDNISTLKSDLEAAYPLMEKLDKLMDKGAKTIDAEIKKAEEESKSGEGSGKEAIKSPLMSHYNRGHSRLLQEGFRQGHAHVQFRQLMRSVIRESIARAS